jgi:hypothetical protein
VEVERGKEVIGQVDGIILNRRIIMGKWKGKGVKM